MRPRAWLFIALLACPAFGQPQRATVEQWRSDIDYLASELPKRHPNLLFHTPRSQFTAQLNVVKADVPRLKDVDIVIQLQLAVASLGDAHTLVNTNAFSMTFFPLVAY